MTEPTAASVKAQVSFEDFQKLDLRVATGIAAEPHPNADRLLLIQVDDGTGTPRQVCAGIKAWYDPKELLGRQVVIVANLAPRTIRGQESQGMILAAVARDGAGDGKGDGAEDVVVLALGRPIAAGSPVS